MVCRVLSLILALSLSTALAYGLKGDVNGDGVIDGKDALKIILILEERIPQPSQDDPFWHEADVFPPGGDGKVDRSDALQILRYVVGTVSEGEITGVYRSPSITSFSPSSGSPGTRVTIRGENFVSANPHENIVMFGVEPAEVVSSTRDQLVAIVPPGAKTSPILVMTPGGWCRTDEDFLVLKEASFKFIPPEGEGRKFKLYTPYGDAEDINSDGIGKVAVSEDYWTLVNALPTTHDKLSYMRVYFPSSSSGEEEISSATTAEALVFLSPFFFSPDLGDAEDVWETIKTDPKVGELAKVIEEVFPNSADPLSDERITQALKEAVESVASRLPDEYKPPKSGGAPARTYRSTALYSGDIRTLTVDRTEDGVEIDTIQTNPMDWVVRVVEIDRDKLYDFFPKGGKSLTDADLHQFYQRESDGFTVRQMRLGKAITRRFAIITTIMSDMVDSLDMTGAGGESEIKLPDREGVYVIRLFAPIFDRSVDNGELDFVENTPELKEDLDRALYLNMAMLVVDMVDGTLGIMNIFDSNSRREMLRATMGALGRATLREFPNGLNEAMDKDERFRRIVRVLKDGIDAMIKQATIEAVNKGYSKVEEMLTKSGGYLGKVAKVASGIMGVTDAISYLGPIGERLAGMAGIGLIEYFGLELSPMETGFVIVGTPFDWEVRGILPDTRKVAPGEKVRIIGRNFDPRGTDKNEVWLKKGWEDEGVKMIVTDVSDAGDMIEFQIPEDCPWGYHHEIYIKTSYCEGFSGFRLNVKRIPRLVELDPDVGFPNQNPYSPAGAQYIYFKAYNVKTSDKVFFGDKETRISWEDEDRANWYVVEAPAGLPAGKVSFYIESPEGKSNSLDFTVLGQPVINEVSPQIIHPGVLVEIRGDNFGYWSDLVRVSVSGYTYPIRYGVINNNLVKFVCPTLDSEGQKTVKVSTPAGNAQYVVTYKADMVTIPEKPELPEGFYMRVSSTAQGVNPDGQLTLDEAILIANGEINPFSDDWKEEREHYISGKVGGKGFQDTISLSLKENVTYCCSAAELSEGDIISGVKSDVSVVGGTLTLGSWNEIEIRKLSGDLKITGDGNTVRVHEGINGGLTIEGGNGNRIADTDCVVNSDGCGIYVKNGSGNSIDFINYVENCDGDGIRVENGVDNYIALVFAPEGKPAISKCGGNGLSIIGGRGNHIDIRVGQSIINNKGAGVHLENTSYNRLSISEISGNGGAGVELINAVSNEIKGISGEGNGGDGVHLYDGCKWNKILVATDGSLDENQNGAVIEGANTANNDISVSSSRNKGYGYIVRNGANHNEIYGKCESNLCGLLMEGSETSYNKISGVFSNNKGAGVVIQNNSHHNFMEYCTAQNNNGAGILITKGASYNRMELLQCVDNKGDGILINEGAHHNVISYSYCITGNSGNGIAIIGENTDFNTIGGRTEIGQHYEDKSPNGGYGILIADGPVGTEIKECYLLFNELGGVKISGISKQWAPGEERFPLVKVYWCDIGANFTNHSGRDVRPYEVKDQQPKVGLGFWVENTSDCEFEQVCVYGADTGVKFINTTSTSLTACMLRNIHETGLSLEESDVILTKVRISMEGNSETAVAISNSSNVKFFDFAISEKGGVHISGSRDIFGSDLLLHGTAQNAIHISNSQNVEIISIEAYSGILVENSTGVRLAPNRVESDSSTIAIKNSEDISILPEDNDARFMLENGEVLVDSSRGVRIGTPKTKDKSGQIRANGGDALLITGESDDVKVANLSITGGGVKITGGRNILIGGIEDRAGNLIAAPDKACIYVQGNIAGLEIRNNEIVSGERGIEIHTASEALVVGNTVSECSREGILITDGASGTVIAQNRITKNIGDGVKISGAGSVNNHITSNVITSNLLKGICLEGGANKGIQPPVITEIGEHYVSGEVESAPKGSVVEIYADYGDEGEKLLGSSHLRGRRFTVSCNPPEGMNLHGVLIDPDGNTSEFGTVRLESRQTLKEFAYTSTRNGDEEIYFHIGYNDIRLTEREGIDRSPSVSPDGVKIAYVSDAGGSLDIWKMNLSGRDKALLTNYPGDEYDPDWSPDGDKLVYIGEQDGEAEIYVLENGEQKEMELSYDDGEADSQIGKYQYLTLAVHFEIPGEGEVHKLKFFIADAPTFPKDLTWIISNWQSGKPGDMIIASGTVKVSEDGWCVADVGNIAVPSDFVVEIEMDFVPFSIGQDTTIPMMRSYLRQMGEWKELDGNLMIRTVCVARQAVPRKVIELPGSEERNPVWSPDGSKIAFASNKNGNWDIFVVNADGTNLTQLTDSPANEVDPTWSPDGSMIAFISDNEGEGDIYVMKADGSDVVNLTNSPSPERDPCWTTEGSILFTSLRNAGWEIYQMRSGGGGVRRLTSSLGENTQPSGK